jgi:probable rRNA maturation factor
MPEVDVSVEDQRWAELGLAGLADRACAAVFQALEMNEDWQVSILGCDDARIAALNTEFRDKPTPTNVLSWPSAERGADMPGQAPKPPSGPDRELGDIAIAFDTCMTEAEQGGIELQDHVTHLIIHATLHLLGYDHENDPDAALMEGLETRILASLGIADPYRTDLGSAGA